MKYAALLLLVFASIYGSAQKHIYDIELFGKKIGSTIVERIDKGDGVVHYSLTSSSEVDILFTHKTSYMNFDIVYKDGKLFSSYCKNVKDGVAEVVTIAWNGTKYIIKKGEEVMQLTQPIEFSAIQLYFLEPFDKPRIFSERIGQFCTFLKKAEGVYECKTENGVINIYRYKKGLLHELEMSKGASVFLKLLR